MTPLITFPSSIMNHHNNSNSTFISPGEQVAIAIRGLCFLLGICGNITVVVVLLRHFRRDNFTLQLMLHLAASDILCLLTMPAWICSFLFGWTMGLAPCKFFCFVTYTGIYASVLTITVMSVQRYIVVLYRPKWSKLGRKGERAVLVGLWVLAGAFSIIPLMTYNVIEDEDKLQCEQVFTSEGEKVGVLTLELLVFCVTPLCTLTTSYVCLHRKVSDRAVSNNRLATLVTSIIATFFMFTTPYFVVSIMVMATPMQPTLSVRRLAHRGPRRAVQSIVLFNSCVNPLLYAFNFRSLCQRANKNVTHTSTDVRNSLQSISTLA